MLFLSQWSPAWSESSLFARYQRRRCRSSRSWPTTKAALQAALARLNEGMLRARAAGFSPLLYFFYSGHGEVKNNEGYANLEDGKLTRSELVALLRRSRADANHVVIDACKSYFLVFQRGAGGSGRR